MKVVIHIPSESLVGAKPTTVHILPCRINYDGPAEVKRFLVIEKESGEDTIDGSGNSAEETVANGHGKEVQTKVSKESGLVVEEVEELKVSDQQERGIGNREEFQLPKSTEVLETVFRGRLLKGRKIPVPTGYKGGHNLRSAMSFQIVLTCQVPSGYVLYDTPIRPPTSPISPRARRRRRGPSPSDVSDDQSLAMHRLALRSFPELVVWGHDQAPGMYTDPYARVGDWCAVASKLHQHVNPESSQSSV
ncbi:hypothetical protein HDU93_009146 [Gonapodya sp. JEL0774]|nr:hypothetical protein HDU93_009146 [Gonapodya sp. JEL0774]